MHIFLPISRSFCTAPEDYSGFTVELIFGPAVTRVCFNVTVTDDDRHERPETFDIVVTTDDNQINIPRPETPFNIEDDDGKWL